MLSFPICKINLGLNVVEKRPDGYHNLETVFYPVPITDALEVYPMDPAFPSDVDCDLKVTNIHIDGVCFRAYTYIYIKVFLRKQAWVAVQATVGL